MLADSAAPDVPVPPDVPAAPGVPIAPGVALAPGVPIAPGVALAPGAPASPKVTVPDVRGRKGSDQPLVMVTAYDAPSARAVARSGADIALVGDSLGMVVLGYEDTLNVILDDMVRHTAAVARVKPPQLIVADLPWTTYHRGPWRAVASAAKLVRAGAEAIKLEGGTKRLEVVAAILDAEIPVMGHVGLTPQSVHTMGGYRVQGRTASAGKLLVEDAIALAEAGCFAIVVEGVPEDVAGEVTASVPVPVIGIGAGPACDGQVLVFHDILGMSGRRAPRFARQYAQLEELAGQALQRWAHDVRAGAFPAAQESYHSQGHHG